MPDDDDQLPAATMRAVMNDPPALARMVVEAMTPPVSPPLDPMSLVVPLSVDPISPAIEAPANPRVLELCHYPLRRVGDGEFYTVRVN